MVGLSSILQAIVQSLVLLLLWPLNKCLSVDFKYFYYNIFCFMNLSNYILYFLFFSNLFFLFFFFHYYRLKAKRTIEQFYRYQFRQQSSNKLQVILNRGKQKWGRVAEGLEERPLSLKTASWLNNFIFNNFCFILEDLKVTLNGAGTTFYFFVFFFVTKH